MRDLRRVALLVGIPLLAVVAGVVAFVVTRPDDATVSPLTSEVPAVVERCSEVLVGDNVTAFVNEFVRRRVDGSGAEACMTADAVETYGRRNAAPFDAEANGGRGPLCLYACGRFRVSSFEYKTEPRDAEVANTYETTIVVTLSDGDETVRQRETISIGFGQASTGERQALVVRDARPEPVERH